MALSKWGCSWEYHYLSCGLTFGWNTPGACPDPHQPLAPSHSPEKGHQAASMQGDRSRGLQANFQKFMSPLYIYKKKKNPSRCALAYTLLPPRLSAQNTDPTMDVVRIQGNVPRTGEGSPALVRGKRAAGAALWISCFLGQTHSDVFKVFRDRFPIIFKQKHFKPKPCAVWSVAPSHLTLRFHGLQPARLLRPWGFSRQEYWNGWAMPSSRGSSQPRDRTQDSRITGRFFTRWTTREAQTETIRDSYDLCWEY